jgi:hypothetical protein
MANDLETPFTITEIHHAISSGRQNRAIYPDVISFEFYKRMWAFIQNDLCSIPNKMFFGGCHHPTTKVGIIICLSKPAQMLTPADRRPITLLNSDLKIATPILTQRLPPIVETHLKRHNTVGCLAITS